MRLVGWLVVVAVVLAALGLAYLRTGWGKDFVRGRVEAALAGKVTGRVAVGAVDYGWFFDHVEVRDLVIRDGEGRDAIVVGGLRADLDRGSLWAGAPVIDRLDVTGVAVAVVQRADGTTNLTGLARPAPPGAQPPIRIAALHVSGGGSFTQRDGVVLTLRDLGIAGVVDARPALGEVDATLDGVRGHLTVTRPAALPTDADLAIAHARLERDARGVTLDVQRLVLGALAVDAINGHLALVDGRFAGAQAVTLSGARVDHTQLATELGRHLLVDDVHLELSVSGPLNLLAVSGTLTSRHTSLSVQATADLSTPARPGYQIALVGKGASADVVPPEAAPLPAIETELRITVVGAGVTRADVAAKVDLAVGPTRVGALAVDGVTATVHADRGALTIDQLAARGLGFTLAASGDVAPDTTLHARAQVTVDPAEAERAVQRAGLVLPPGLPPLPPLTLSVAASGSVAAGLDVDLAPTRVALAGGAVTLGGRAHVKGRVVEAGHGTVALRGLDLASLARLAGKPAPPVGGALSGTIAIAQIGAARSATYDVTVAVREPALSIVASGRADPRGVTTRARIVRADGAALGTIAAEVPLDDHGFAPTRAWHVVLDLTRRPLDELIALAPPALRRALPPGDVAVRADLTGTPAQPRGTIDVTGSAIAPELGRVQAALRATIAPGAAGGIAVATTGEVTSDALGPVATIAGEGSAPPIWRGRHLDLAALRTGLAVAGTLTLSERPLASLPRAPVEVAALGGRVGGTIRVTGAPPALALDARLAWRGYETLDGGATGETTLAVTGAVPQHLTATLVHAGALTVTVDADRDGAAWALRARTAADAPLRAVLPGLALFSVRELRAAELGHLRTDLGASLRVVPPTATTALAIADLHVAGALAITGGAFALPHTDRKWEDIGLTIAGTPDGLRVASLDVRERDRQDADRRFHAEGALELTALRPRAAHLVVATHHWLTLGARSPLLSDAPIAEADLDAHVDADLSGPVVAVDATIDHLDLRAPDRRDRAHQPEASSIAGDVIFVGSPAEIGKLPVPTAEPPPPALPIPLDVRVHLPTPIHAVKAPLDVTATGELTITVRGGAPVTRGRITLASGTLTTFGQPHALVAGTIDIAPEHPHGELDLTFARALPEWSARDLARPERGQRIHLGGDPAKPVVTLSGVANDTLPEVFAMYYAGRPTIVAPPGLPASATAEAPRGDQLNILAYLSLVIPHLLVLDHVSAWSDATEPRGGYGRIRNLEADRYAPDGRSRVRVVGRPTEPGRSTAEVQWDHLWVHDAHAALGGGARAGDRLGGGVGLFFEWSSAD